MKRFAERVEPIIRFMVPKLRAGWIGNWLRSKAIRATMQMRQRVADSCPGHGMNDKCYLAVLEKSAIVIVVCETKRHDTRYKSRIDCVVRTFLIFEGFKMANHDTKVETDPNTGKQRPR